MAELVANNGAVGGKATKAADGASVRRAKLVRSAPQNIARASTTTTLSSAFPLVHLEQCANGVPNRNIPLKHASALAAAEDTACDRWRGEPLVGPRAFVSLCATCSARISDTDH